MLISSFYLMGSIYNLSWLSIGQIFSFYMKLYFYGNLLLYEYFSGVLRYQCIVLNLQNLTYIYLYLLLFFSPCLIGCWTFYCIIIPSFDSLNMVYCEYNCISLCFIKNIWWIPFANFVVWFVIVDQFFYLMLLHMLPHKRRNRYIYYLMITGYTKTK